MENFNEEMNLPSPRDEENAGEMSDFSDTYAENPPADAEGTVEGDLGILREEFPELKALESITELKNPTRYAALRDLGLSAQEAYLATNPRVSAPDNRAHLTSGVPVSAKAPLSSMTKGQMAEARELFKGMSDAEIQKLYQKVTR